MMLVVSIIQYIWVFIEGLKIEGWGEIYAGELVQSGVQFIHGGLLSWILPYADKGLPSADLLIMEN